MQRKYWGELFGQAIQDVQGELGIFGLVVFALVLLLANVVYYKLVGVEVGFGMIVNSPFLLTYVLVAVIVGVLLVFIRAFMLLVNRDMANELRIGQLNVSLQALVDRAKPQLELFYHPQDPSCLEPKYLTLAPSSQIRLLLSDFFRIGVRNLNLEKSIEDVRVILERARPDMHGTPLPLRPMHGFDKLVLMPGQTSYVDLVLGDYSRNNPTAQIVIQTTVTGLASPIESANYEFDITAYGSDVPPARVRLSLQVERDNREDQDRIVLRLLENY